MSFSWSVYNGPYPAHKLCDDRYMKFYLICLTSLILLSFLMSCTPSVERPITIEFLPQINDESIPETPQSHPEIYNADLETTMFEDTYSYPNPTDTVVFSDITNPKDKTVTESSHYDTEDRKLKLPTPENTIRSPLVIYFEPTATPITETEDSPTINKIDEIPVTVHPTPQNISTPRAKCPEFPIPMTILGRSLSDQVTVWTGDKLLSETSEFILNYILTVPVCDESGNFLQGQPFRVKGSDGLSITGTIANGARHNINLIQSHTPATITPTSTPPPQLSSITVTIPTISEILSGLPDYDRDEWSHWSDDDGDCQNTRHEVLIIESLESVTFKDNDSCTVEYGKWIDKYTGNEIAEASALDVDHMIPLHNAHISGGWKWSSSKRKTFANYLAYENHLIAVTASANRQKGSRSPDEWKPGLTSYWCQYGLDWINIKLEWNLSVTSSEWTALQGMLATCATNIHYIGENTATPTPAPTGIPPTPTPNSPASVEISSVSCSGQPEIIYIQNTGASSVDLTGWRIEDEGPNYTMSFPSGFTVDSGSTVQIHSAASGEDSESIIYWTGRYVLNNNNDTAHLFDASGNMVSQMSC